MSYRVLAGLCLWSLWLVAAAALAQAPALEQSFASPAESTKPWVYWYWLSGHFSHEGITKDLEAMKSWGVGRAVMGDINRGNIERGSVDLSEEYFAALEHAVREGKRLGVDIALFNCPGWSQTGGPWVKPEQSMRYLLTTERRVKGPMKFNEKLADPERLSPPEKPVPEDLVQNVAVLAYPASALDTDGLPARKPRITVVPAMENAAALFDGDPATVGVIPVAMDKKTKPRTVIEIALEAPMTVRSLTFRLPSKGIERDRAKPAIDADCELLVDDGGQWRSVHKFSFKRMNFGESVGPNPRGAVTAAFAPVAGRRFQVILSNFNLQKGAVGWSVSEIELSGAARLDRYIEKQLGKMFPGIFPPWDYYLYLPAQPEPDQPGLAIDPQRIVNLSERFKDGVLTWDVPEGDWIITRVVMKPTGVKNRPASREATGLEVDKLSAAAMREHYDAYVGKLVRRMKPEDRSALKGLIIDSYETGSQNWTDGFEKKFMEVYGYDPRPWLVTLTGRLVGSAQQSDRFLWDLRRLVADQVAATYGALRDMGRQDGLELWLEPYGHYGYPAEFLQCGGQADGVGGEFWINPKHGDMEVLAAASSAYIYGKKIISAEAFTGTPSYNFTQDPWSLKALGDLQHTLGVNHYVLHLYIHQPYEKPPGMNSWFGTEFNRHNTWFDRGRPWVDYLRRSHALLQQGLPVADVAYFIGEDAPKMAGVKEPPLPAGYTSHFINGEVIRTRLAVKDGRFVLPDGMSYRLLVLPPLETMRPELLRTIRGLVEQGGAVYGPPPRHSPSLQDYPRADATIAELAKEMWADLDGKGKTSRQLGKGKIFWGGNLAEVLARLDAPPDVMGLEASGMLWSELEGPMVPWIHRTAADADLYYLSNQTDKTVKVSPSFRVVGRPAQVWDPVSTRRYALEAKSDGGRTTVNLELAPRQSVFVVLGAQSDPPPLPAAPAPIAQITGPWTVKFDPRWGGPAEPVAFPALINWIEHDNPAIRNYSGKAVYTKEIDLPAAGGRRLLLDLGFAASLARVTLNGQDLGVVWTAPWQVDLTSAARPGKNALEVEITNTWVNRLLVEEKSEGAQRLTWTASPAIRAQKPQTSGLIGPVRVLGGP